MNRLAWLISTSAFLCTTLLFGQGTSEPHPCGSVVRHGLPENFSVLIDSGGGPARIRFRSTDSAVDIEFPSVTDAFQEACQISDERLLVFGVVGPPLYHVGIVDPKNGVLVDSFYCYSPALSPDGRRLIMRRFYPSHAGAAVFSEQYFIYDLQKSPAENRIDYSDDPALGDAVGTLVYPVEENKRPYEHVNLQANEIHAFASLGFYWSTDSKAVAFADRAQEGLSLVLVSIRDSSFHTYLHALSIQEVCSAPIKNQQIPYMLLSGAQLAPRGDGTYDVSTEFALGGAKQACGSRPVVISAKEFEPAKLQKHPPQPPRPKLVIVPKPN